MKTYPFTPVSKNHSLGTPSPWGPRTWGTRIIGTQIFDAYQISRITGMIIGLRPVVFWIMRLSSTRTFSLTMP